MAITKMRKVSLVAHNCERNKILRIFLKNGCMEFVPSEKAPDTASMQKRIEELESKRFKVAFALSFLKDVVKEINLNASKKEKLSPEFKKENRLIPYEEFVDVAKDEVEYLSKIGGMEKYNTRLTDMKSEQTRIDAAIEQLSVYREIALPFGCVRDTKTSVAYLGVVPTEKVGIVRDKLPSLAEAEFSASDKVTAVLILAHRSCREFVEEILQEAEFVRASFTLSGSAKEEIDGLQSKKEALKKERKRIVEDAANFLTLLPQLKILYDYYEMEIEKVKAIGGCEQTGKTILMEGWVPQDKEKKVREEIEKVCTRVEMEFRDPTDDEIPPTCTKNNKFISAFDGITDMFGAPSYRERDPKLFVALYYFLIFGFMLGDAGYGLLMTIACFVFTSVKKTVKNSGQMMIMFGFCGISTFIWGALFGGWFGTIPAFMQNLHLYWFQPLEEPLIMFALALGVGLLQIATGFALHGVALIEQGGIKNILMGVLKDFGWVVLIIGVFFFSPSLLAFLGIIGDVTPAVSTLVEVGKYTALVGAGMMLISGVIGKKNPVKAVGGILGNAYGAVNVVSDLLSYSRLFGLGLTSGVIGYVVNMLATIIVNTFFKGLWVGWIIAVPVLLIGHTFNLAINLLGAYVHDSRLQYIEFFGRFYEGTGHAFKPLGSSGKYTYLDN